MAPPSGKFYGDCEDYAFSLQQKMGGEVWHVVLPDKRHHAILLSDNYVYDSLQTQRIRKNKYKAAWLFVIKPKKPLPFCKTI